MNKKTKSILFVVNVDWFFVSHRLPIAIEALKKGYEVNLICKVTDFRKYITNKGIILHDWDLERSSINPLTSIQSIFKLLIKIRKIKPDLIHAISMKAVAYCIIVNLILKNYPVIYSIAGLGYAYSKDNFKTKFIRNILNKIFKTLNFKDNYHFIFQNNFDQSKFIRISNIPKYKTTLIPGSGVDLNIYKPIKKKQTLTNKPVFLFAARLLKSKGILEFINAAKEFKNAKFYVAGKFDNDNEDCISQNDIQFAIDKKYIDFLGFKKDMISVLNSSSVVVLPSYYGEGMPKILIEAAACGKPIITTDHPGCRDSIIDGVTGLLIESRNTKKLVEAIRFFIENPSSLSLMGKESRKFAIKNFNIKDVINFHFKIYDNLLNS